MFLSISNYSVFSLAGPSHLLFDFDLITLKFIMELIQPSYVKGLLTVADASFILNILCPSLARFTLGTMGCFSLRSMWSFF